MDYNCTLNAKLGNMQGGALRGIMKSNWRKLLTEEELKQCTRHGIVDILKRNLILDSKTPRDGKSDTKKPQEAVR
jgi:hypothetical protein